MVVFKRHDSVPSARYSSICNVLRQWRIWLIPTYRVYQLYDKTCHLKCLADLKCMGAASGCGVQEAGVTSGVGRIYGFG